MGQRNIIFTDWQYSPHALACRPTFAEVVRAAAHSVTWGDDSADMRTLKACAATRDPERHPGVTSAGLLLRMCPGFAVSPKEIVATAAQLNYRCGGLADLLALAAGRHKEAMRRARALYAFGDDVVAPDDPTTILVPKLTLEAAEGLPLLSCVRMHGDRRHFESYENTGVRKSFLYVEENPLPSGVCTCC